MVFEFTEVIAVGLWWSSFSTFFCWDIQKATTACQS